MPIGIAPLMHNLSRYLTQDPIKYKNYAKMFQPSIHDILPILAIITPGLSHNEYELFNLSYPQVRERTSVVSRLVVFMRINPFCLAHVNLHVILDRLTFFF